MENQNTSPTKADYFVIVLLCLVSGVVGFLLGFSLSVKFYSPPSRSAVYEIPMVKRHPWRVTVYDGKVYVLIEAPSMPEGIKEGAPPP